MQKALWLLLFCSTAVNAEWTLITTTTTDGANMYADLATIRKQGSYVKYWSLTDYKTVQGTGARSYFSAAMQMEYDCAEERYRLLYSSVYAGKMATGENVGSNNARTDWTPVQPNTTSAIYFDVVCKPQRQ